MSSQSKPLDGLVDVAGCKEIKEIVDGARKSLQIIEPWREAESDHPQLQLVIQKIQAHSAVYFEAIDTSIKTAQDGYGFSTDVIELCGFLLDRDTNPADLEGYLTDRRDKVMRAHKDSKVTLEKFRDVRKGLLGITKKIPKKALASPQEGKDFVVRFVPDIVGEKHDVEIDKALEELNLVPLDMDSLSDSVDKFATWWTTRENLLAGMRQDSHDLRPGQNALRVKRIRKKWTKIQDDYMRYKVEVCSRSYNTSPEPESRPIRSEDAVKSPPWAKFLQDAEHGLAELIDKMSNLADSLLAMDALPDDIHARVQELRPSSTLRMKLKNLAADLNQVGLECERDFARLEDLNQTTKVMSPSVPPPILPLPSQSDPPAGLADVKSCKEIKGIVDGAFKALQIIESWKQAETNHPQLQVAIKKIQAHSLVYFEAIDTSIKTAQDGYNFSTDAIGLCGFLLDQDTDPADLKEYIADMQDKAKCAHEDSRRTWFKFRDVRTGLIEITEAMKEVLASPQESKSLVIRFASCNEGEKQEVEIDKALEELDRVALDMKNLLDNVNKFAAWWAAMETLLAETKKNSQRLKPGQNKLLVKQIRNKWTTIQEDYQQYKIEIIKLQDHYPSRITGT